MAVTKKSRAKPANGKALANWQKEAGLNDRDACVEIGLSRNTFMKYRDGEDGKGAAPLPKIVALALEALNARLA